MLSRTVGWDVSLLEGAEVWLRQALDGERHGEIVGVRTRFASEDKEQAINGSVFLVRLDGGETHACFGRDFGRIDSADYP